MIQDEKMRFRTELEDLYNRVWNKNTNQNIYHKFSYSMRKNLNKLKIVFQRLMQNEKICVHTQLKTFFCHPTTHKLDFIVIGWFVAPRLY